MQDKTKTYFDKNRKKIKNKTEETAPRVDEIIGITNIFNKTCQL